MSPILVVLVASLLSILSAIIVALLSYFFSLKQDRKNELAEMRIKAYSDFINCISRLVSARRIGETDNELNDLAFLNDAKNRICICGEISVVEALMKFWTVGGTLEDEREVLAFTDLCRKMRHSLGNNKHDTIDLRLSDTLFKIEPSQYSFRAEEKGNK